MDQNIEKLYRSAVHLLTTPFVLSRKEEYPQAHVMNAARRGLLRACLRFKSSTGVKFIHYAEFLIRNSVRQCIAKEVSESKPEVVGYMPSNMMEQLQKYKASISDEERRARHEKRRRDVAKYSQWKKTVEQARLYRKLMKNR